MKSVRFLPVILILVANVASALLPPPYLSVPQWKSCVSVTTRGSAQYVCLPNSKPYYCPISSWNTLTQGNMLPPCPFYRTPKN